MYPRTKETILKICNSLDVSPSTFFSEDEDALRPLLLSKETKPASSKIIDDIEKMYQNKELNKEDKDAILQLIKLTCEKFLKNETQ